MENISKTALKGMFMSKNKWFITAYPINKKTCGRTANQTNLIDSACFLSLIASLQIFVRMLWGLLIYDYFITESET
jgi:hypothetical protein